MFSTPSASRHVAPQLNSSLAGPPEGGSQTSTHTVISFNNEMMPLCLLDGQDCEAEASTFFGRGTSGLEETDTVQKEFHADYEAIVAVSTSLEEDIFLLSKSNTIAQEHYDGTSEQGTILRLSSSHQFPSLQHRALLPSSFASESSGSSNHHCELCNKSFTLQKDLERHKRSIHDQESFVCLEPSCGRKFRRKDKLLQHGRRHSTTEATPRQNISSTDDFISLHQSSAHGRHIPLAQHAKLSTKHDTLEIPPFVEIESAAKSTRKRLACPTCERSFSLQHDRLRHIRTLHGSEPNHVAYRCAVAGCTKQERKWRRLDNFKKHLMHKHQLMGNEEELLDLIQKSKSLGAHDDFTVITPETFSQ